jgi:hypothetical protein
MINKDVFQDKKLKVYKKKNKINKLIDNLDFLKKIVYKVILR